jgi:hypothetical protein
MEDYYIAIMIRNGVKGDVLLRDIKRNIEAKCGDSVAFTKGASQRSHDAASTYYHYRKIILTKGEQYLYDEIMRAYNPKTDPGLPGKTDVRGPRCRGKNKFRFTYSGQG